MGNEVDRGAWWVEGRELHIDVPRLLQNMELRDTNENRKLAVEIIKEVAAVDRPRVTLTVVREEVKR